MVKCRLKRRRGAGWSAGRRVAGPLVEGQRSCGAERRTEHRLVTVRGGNGSFGRAPRSACEDVIRRNLRVPSRGCELRRSGRERRRCRRTKERHIHVLGPGRRPEGVRREGRRSERSLRGRHSGRRGPSRCWVRHGLDPRLAKVRRHELRRPGRLRQWRRRRLCHNERSRRRRRRRSALGRRAPRD